MPNDEPQEPRIARAGADRSIESSGRCARMTQPRVDGTGIVIGSRIRLDTVTKLLCRAAEPVEIRVAYDRVHASDPSAQLGGHHLRTGAVLGFRGKDESGILLVLCM